MEFEPITLTVKSGDMKDDTVGFKGRPLGRYLGKKLCPDLYEESVEIYQTDQERFVVYGFCRGDGGGIHLADWGETETLDLGAVRSCLKEKGIYPGPSYTAAVHNSLKTLQFLQKLGFNQ